MGHGIYLGVGPEVVLSQIVMGWFPSHGIKIVEARAELESDVGSTVAIPSHNAVTNNVCRSIPVDPAGGHCY